MWEKLPFFMSIYWLFRILKWGASFLWSCSPKSVWGSKETTTIAKTHPTLFWSITTHLLSLYRELYENTDPILPVEVVIPMIMDPETGEWRKKTMHERYNKNRQVDRSREQYLRKKSEKESKKASKESKQLRSVFKLSALFWLADHSEVLIILKTNYSDMSLEELEKEAKKTKSKTERSLIE